MLGPAAVKTTVDARGAYGPAGGAVRDGFCGGCQKVHAPLVYVLNASRGALYIHRITRSAGVHIKVGDVAAGEINGAGGRPGNGGVVGEHALCDPVYEVDAAHGGHAGRKGAGNKMALVGKLVVVVDVCVLHGPGAPGKHPAGSTVHGGAQIGIRTGQGLRDALYRGGGQVGEPGRGHQGPGAVGLVGADRTAVEILGGYAGVKRRGSAGASIHSQSGEKALARQIGRHRASLVHLEDAAGAHQRVI